MRQQVITGASASGAQLIEGSLRFDKDEDPVVCYYNETPETITESFYHWHVEVIDGTN